jgi:5-methylcytosine-specific restriction endonuclease McrA
MEKKVLLLNLSEEVLGIITWTDAVKKIFRNVAQKPYGYNDVYKIPTVKGDYEIPTAIVLSEYKRIPYRRVALTPENLLKRDGFRCQYCNKLLNRKTMTMDHVFPECRGGKKVWKNIVTACKSCNNIKDKRTPKEANMKLINKPTIPNMMILFTSASERKIRDSWKRWIA